MWIGKVSKCHMRSEWNVKMNCNESSNTTTTNDNEFRCHSNSSLFYCALHTFCRRSLPSLISTFSCVLLCLARFKPHTLLGLRWISIVFSLHIRWLTTSFRFSLVSVNCFIILVEMLAFVSHQTCTHSHTHTRASDRQMWRALPSIPSVALKLIRECAAASNGRENARQRKFNWMQE